MNMNYSAADAEFQRAVQTFLTQELTPELKLAAARTTTVFCEKDAVSGTFQWLTLFKPFFENPFLSLFLLTSRNPSLWDVLYKSKKGKK